MSDSGEKKDAISEGIRKLLMSLIGTLCMFVVNFLKDLSVSQHEAKVQLAKIELQLDSQKKSIEMLGESNRNILEISDRLREKLHSLETKKR